MVEKGRQIHLPTLANAAMSYLQLNYNTKISDSFPATVGLNLLDYVTLQSADYDGKL